jgi:phosphatidylserine/phosphatidylglycerophosphate/cardiolipin synthase-like enzyme
MRNFVWRYCCWLSIVILFGGSTTTRTWAADVQLPSTLGIQAEVIGVYFAPSPHAAQSIVQAVQGSEREVLVEAYGFTHNGIAQALLRAHQRGVVVRVLMDAKSAVTNRYVIDALRQEKVHLRLDDKHAIAHNKVMVIDESVVITGSFNFTNSAANRNAENVLILKSPDLAQRYKADWLKHWAHSVD